MHKVFGVQEGHTRGNVCGQGQLEVVAQVVSGDIGCRDSFV